MVERTRPAGVDSPRVTPAAVDGPTLAIVVVYVAVEPGVTDEGPVLVT
jgi:hypothetical protein